MSEGSELRPNCWHVPLKRIVALVILLFSPLFISLHEQMVTVAVPVTRTTTHTVVTTYTMAEPGTTTLFQTFTQASSVLANMTATYVASGTTLLPVVVLTTKITILTATLYSYYMTVRTIPTTRTYTATYGVVSGGYTYRVTYRYTVVYSTTEPWMGRTAFPFLSTQTVTTADVVSLPVVVMGTTTREYATYVPTTVLLRVGVLYTVEQGEVITFTWREAITYVIDEPSQSTRPLSLPALSPVEIILVMILGLLIFDGVILVLLWLRRLKTHSKEPLRVRSMLWSKLGNLVNLALTKARRELTTQPSAEDAIAILKLRLAKGEITKEQYEELLKAIKH